MLPGKIEANSQMKIIPHTNRQKHRFRHHSHHFHHSSVLWDIKRSRMRTTDHFTAKNFAIKTISKSPSPLTWTALACATKRPNPRVRCRARQSPRCSTPRQTCLAGGEGWIPQMLWWVVCVCVICKTFKFTGREQPQIQIIKKKKGVRNHNSCLRVFNLESKGRVE